MKRLFALGTLSMLVACSMGQTERIRSITLERYYSLFPSPTYTLTLRSDGTATYHGKRFVQRIGDYTGFWAGNGDRLAWLTNKLGFWKLKKSYSFNIPDQSTQVLTVVTERGKRTITEYGWTSPEELWALQTLVDGVGANVHWTKVKRK